MVLRAPPTQRHEVQILGSGFQFSGQLETVGSVMAFINDPARESFSLYDAYLTPLTPGSPLKGFSRSLIIVRRPQISFVYFTSAETRASLQLLQREELIVAYMPVAVCRGGFHVTAEARVRDFIDTITGYFVPVSGAQLFPLVELPAPFPLEADLLLVNRTLVQSYHSA